MNNNLNWWRDAVVYQIYPRSFMDSNNDGVGDLGGIIAKLDYIKQLGVDAIWLNPIYKSPMKDFGYDVSDFYEIDPIFGTKKDFKKLVSKAHSLDLKIIMDMTFNHTSDEHPWFIESRSSVDNPKRDWYIWHPRKGIGKPNNWRSMFGGSAWKFDKKTNAFYLHLYTPEQPDLNWKNPEVRKAMFDVCKYWLDLGVDGFRMDSAHTLSKVNLSKNNRMKWWGLYDYDRQVTENLSYRNTNQIWRDFRGFLDKTPGKIIVGEIDPPNIDKVKRERFYGNGDNEFNLVFNFSIMFQLWSANIFRKKIEAWYKCLPAGAQPCWVFDNHDVPRSISRYALFHKRSRLKRAKVAATMLLTIFGTPFIYYGQEIGMSNGKIKRSQLLDPVGKRFWPFFKGRDGCRTPMQWDGTEFSGFSTKTPWLPLNKNHASVNVFDQKADQDSLLNYYKNLLSVRKKSEVLEGGEYKNIYCKRNVWAYSRKSGDHEMITILNFSGFRRKFYIDKKWAQVLSSEGAKREHSYWVDVRPNEAIILEVV